MRYYYPLALALAASVPAPAAAQLVSAAAVPAPAAPQAPDSGHSAPLAAPTIYYRADEMPSFPGGGAALLKFLNQKMQYPAAALDQHLSGKVHVTFVIDDRGHPRDPRVVRGLGGGLDEEAVRLVRLMPWWNPGKINGQPVWVSVTMPLVFRAL